MIRIPRARTGAAAAAVVLATLLGACGDDEPRTGGVDGGQTPTETSSQGSSSPAAPPSSSEPPADDATEPGSSTVAPATGGPVLRTEDDVAITTPGSFRGSQVSEDGGISIIIRPSDLAEISLSTGSLIGAPDFEEYKRVARTTRESLPALKVLPDRELLGQPAYHFVSEVTEFQRQDTFGVALLEEDLGITVRIVTLKDMPAAEREELVGSVLASLRLP